MVGKPKMVGMERREGRKGEFRADGGHDGERTNQQAALSRYAVMAAGHRPV